MECGLTPTMPVGRVANRCSWCSAVLTFCARSHSTGDVGTLPNQTWPNGTSPAAAKNSGSNDYGGELSWVGLAPRHAALLARFRC